MTIGPMRKCMLLPMLPNTQAVARLRFSVVLPLTITAIKAAMGMETTGVHTVPVARAAVPAAQAAEAGADPRNINEPPFRVVRFVFYKLRL